MWLANKETAMLCIIIVIMWQYVGYHMVIQLAAMRNIDSSFYEAAADRQVRLPLRIHSKDHSYHCKRMSM